MNPRDSRRCARLPLLCGLLAGIAFASSPLAAAELLVSAVSNTVYAEVVALDQPWTFNRLGSTQPSGMVFALKRDVVSTTAGDPSLQPGHVALRADKRPRPLTLRVNAGQFLEIRFTNLLSPVSPPTQGIGTRAAGVHIAGLELVPTANPPSNVVLPGIDSDATWVGKNSPGYAQPGETRTYKYYAKAEGTFMLYSAAGDWNGQLQAGLFGAAIVEPANSEWYRSQVTHDDLMLAARVAPANAGQPGSTLAPKVGPDGRQLTVVAASLAATATAAGEQLLFSFVEVEAVRETVHKTDVVISNGRLFTPDGRPLIDYNAVYPTVAGDPRSGQPILRMTRRHDGVDEIVHSDLTAIITGPGGGEFPFTQNGPGFFANPTYPGRRQPFREITVMYHEIFAAVQAFPQFTPGTPLSAVLNAGTDAFAINYGSAGIGAEVLASRLGVGPMGGKQSVDLKFEEFFLSSWACGDPAMLVDNPANSGATATKAFYPDDPSNVYHSYMRDHVTMRLLHTGSGITHVHHLHAHQWLRTPNSDDAHYLDSQLIAPGSTYTLEMVYNGSGNRNETVGDSIFHCHFYPHFAGGMWALWRVHDVFEAGTQLDATGKPVAGLNRALPDAEIVAGTPIPAIIPLPTLAMAPAPALVQLVDHGTRVEVQPKSVSPTGEPSYDNPGFPFFVPGVTGHRAPHPPLDYAWEESSLGVPKLDANGQKIYLDGGLPRHQVLDGTIVRELHTRWDFSKDFIAYDHPEMPHQPIAGGLIAFELPEEGTAVEKAAMAAHATRTRASFLPNGDPGNFTLNGLPPVPGAPFANPSVDADGNGEINTRRYQGAAIQTDVVLTKQGWHYPQQRFLSLWQDVKDYMAGTRPPQPLFFRAQTGETIEFWHTNLVPDYYDLDDFQIRTPTDIIGQHIHLVKFDVTSSDGAGNGWNYEDGTFSPDEVRGRIDAMNLSGGIFAFDPKTQFKGASQRSLNATPAPAVFGPAPAGQSWIGAQTTIQRWDTDPVENNKGEDRTLRTVFTHDHFGPSTHQQVGLYGGLLVEPQGSTWYDPISGGLLYDTSKRTDGGPTSWQANIVAANKADSYREFALEFADFQLAYLSGSPSTRQAPTAPLFTTSFAGGLRAGPVSSTSVVATTFVNNGVTLAANAALSGSDAAGWTLTSSTAPGVNNNYTLTLLTAATPAAPATYQVLPVDPPLSWSAPLYAVNPSSIDVVNQASGAPFPALISTPPPPGTFSLNYRAEPVSARVWDPQKKLPAAGQSGDLSFAYASIPRADPRLNVQPAPGTPINPSDPNSFKFPANINPTVNIPLAPPLIDNTKVQPTDPFTPMLRAYAGDKVQIRTLVGAHHDSHFFSVDGVKWLFEPGSSNSGYRNNQPMGISEHYEMEFDLPAATAATSRPFADYLYNASARTDAVTAGIWGLMRSYKVAIPNLVPLPNNPPPAQPAVLAIAPPAGVKPREFNVVATTAAQALATRSGGQLVYNSRGQVASLNPTTFTPNTSIANPNALIFFRAEDLDASGQLKAGVPIEPLILRAAAGEWIKLTLKNAFDPKRDPAAFRNGTPADAPYGNAQFFSIPQQVGTDNFVNDLNGNPTAKPAVPPVITPALIAAFKAAGYALAPNAVVTPAQQPGNPIGWAIIPAAPTAKSPDPLTDPANMHYALNLNGNNAIVVSPTIIENASQSVGLNPQVLGYDITTANGVNVGFNPTVTAAPGQTVTAYWYAGTLTQKNGQLAGTPVEFGAINLNSSDPLMQHPQGLVGGLVIEPEGSTWTEDATMRAAATVTKAGGQGTFRDFVMIAQDDLAIPPAANPVTTNSVNYGTEPMSYRYPAASNPVGNPTVDVQAATSNALVGGADPQTPIYTAVAGSEVRFRMLHPANGAGNDGETLTIDGHVFQEEPFINDSRTIGYNELSQWFGTRGGHGARDRFDVVLASAGGDFKVPGDYLYRSLVTIFGSDFTAGKWGIFRVTPLSTGAKLQTAALTTAPAKVQVAPAATHPSETPTSKRFRNRAKTVEEQIKASVPDALKS